MRERILEAPLCETRPQSYVKLLQFLKDSLELFVLFPQLQHRSVAPYRCEVTCLSGVSDDAGEIEEDYTSPTSTPAHGYAGIGGCHVAV